MRILCQNVVSISAVCVGLHVFVSLFVSKMLKMVKGSRKGHRHDLGIGEGISYCET